MLDGNVVVISSQCSAMNAHTSAVAWRLAEGPAQQEQGVLACGSRR